MAIPQTTRRQFLKGTGVLVVSFSLSGPLSRVFGQTAAAPAKSVATDEVDAFLAIGQDGTVKVYTGKVDLGTGIRTALSQIAAEELDVPVERIDLVSGDTAITPDQGPTFGSLSIQVGGMQIRQAAATARKALLDLAAQRRGAAPADLEVNSGVVRVKADPVRNLSYAELIGDREFHLKIDKQGPLKNPASYTIVGRSIPRVDIPAMVTGKFTYIHDVRVPGMLHGGVVRPPAIGATLLSVEERSVKDVPGLKKVVRIGNFLGVVAETEWGAMQAAEKLQATWSQWEGLPEQEKLWEVVRATPIAKTEVTLDVGDPKSAVGGAAITLTATYAFGIQTHGSIGPSCAIADVRDGRATIWSASQAPHWLRKLLAEMLSMPAENIRVIYVAGSGCYGRNGHEDAAADAALLSGEVGRPIRVQWTRADEHGWDPKGPPALIDLRAGLDANGRVIAWESEFRVAKTTAITDAPPFVALILAGLPHKESVYAGNLFHNSAPPYAFPNARAVVHRLQTVPFRPGWIRTPGRLQNTFANEAFMDELAAAAGVDPVKFRLRHLTDQRGLAVLRAVATRAEWEKRPSPKTPTTGAIATGRGVSYVKYENARTYVAAVAEIEVDRASGAIRVRRVVVAQDCGQIINPDGVRSQIEGNVIQTVSRTLKEELKWDRSRVTSIDWKTYPILTFPEVPDVEIELIDRPTEPPWGVGEPAATVIPSAVSNAVFDAIGVRLRTVPFTPERVKAAVRART
jgi:CO/xanthine dehydrogenase Mo-binding subunit